MSARDDERTSPPPIRILALGSLGITALGLGLMARDVFTQAQSGAAWLPLIAGSVGLAAAAIWNVVADPVPRKPIEAPPTDARARRVVLGVVGVLLVVQALAPMRYYLGDDHFDERFSWRMFSAVRVYSCRLSAFETRGDVERPTRLMSTVHVGWITTMRRGREAVIQRYLRWRCEQEGVEAARVVNQCTTPEGNRVPDLVRTIDCGSGELGDGMGAAP